MSAEVDSAYADLGRGAEALAKISPGEAASLLREVLVGLEATAAETVALGCRAKGVDPASSFAGEEWLAGPCVILAYAREVAEKLEKIAKGGPPFPGSAPKPRRRDEKLTAACGPGNALVRAALSGTELTAVFEKGLDAEAIVARQASRWRSSTQPPRISLVLGAGNVASIAPVDVLGKVFVDREAVLLKPSPVNDYLAPVLERAFAPLIARGMLRIVKGGPEIGQALVAHAEVSDIHITGSVETHDRIVWGQGEDRARRKKAGDPLFARPITSELGNVSPVIVVPSLYATDELVFQAKSVAAQVTNNASFNCNAAKMLVLPRGWAQRARFLDLVMDAMNKTPTRAAYYPGAEARYARLTEGRSPRVAGKASEGKLPWTLIDGLDPASADPLFSTEPFCCIVSEVSIGSDDPIEFVAEAARFCNDKLFGTLCAEIIVHPTRLEDPVTANAIDDAIDALRYGAVAVNTWPALVYASATPPWGGHPTGTLADVQSGIGWSHNAWMLEGVEKVVVRSPLLAAPKPAFFADNAKMLEIGERLAAHLAHPGPVNLARLVWQALRA